MMKKLYVYPLSDPVRRDAVAAKDKLTLTVDREVIRRAKELARRWDTSVSGLVEERLRALTEPEGSRDSPLVDGLRGTLPSDVRLEEHREALEEKHAE